MLKYLVAYIRGYVRISVTGQFAERFLNICKETGIRVWNVRCRGSELFHLDISASDYRHIAPVVRRSRTKVRIISRHGLPFVLNRHKKRKAFFIGGIVFVLMLFLVTSFIWSVEVVGNEKTDEIQLAEALRKYGIKEGALRYGHDLNDLQNRMMLEFDGLSWMWVRIKGTRAIVEVKEKTPAPEFIDEGTPCNIVASVGGLITEINATQGMRMANVGDVVREGTLLISGITDTRYGGVRYIHSTGKVSARTWRTKTAKFPLKKTKILKTGKKISKNTMIFFGFRVKLYMDENPPFECFEKETLTRALSLGRDFVLPVAVERDIYYETIKEEEKFTPEKIALAEGRGLCDALSEQISEGGVILNRNVEIISNDGATVELRAVIECIEDIGRPVVIETD